MSLFGKHSKVIILGILVVAICVGYFVTRPKKKPTDLRVVQVAQYGDVFIYTPLYLADVKGFFAEEGLKIELTSTGGDDVTYAAVMSGAASFGVADPAFVAISKEKGRGEGRVIGALVNGVPFWALTRKDIPQITDGKMLEPYRVATYEAPSTAYSVQLKMFEEAGLKPNIVEGTYGGILAMLESNRADIGLELEPNVSTGLAEGAKTVYSFLDYYPEFAFTGITTSLKTIEEDPDLVQHFINAITRAERYAHQHPDSVARYMRDLYPDVDGSIVKSAINRMVNSNVLPENAIISEESWKASIKLRHDIGDLQSPSDAMSVLDMSFATKAAISQ